MKAKAPALDDVAAMIPNGASWMIGGFMGVGPPIRLITVRIQAGQAVHMPITSIRRVDLVVTEMAVIRPTLHGLELIETAPEVTVQDVISATEAHLQVVANVLL